MSARKNFSPMYSDRLRPCKLPAVKNSPGPNLKNFQSSESNKSDVALNSGSPAAEYARICAFKRLFGRNALDPALVREFFVVGKIESNNQPNLRGIVLRVVSSPNFAFGF